MCEDSQGFIRVPSKFRILMIVQPEWFTQDVYEQAKTALQKKKNPPALSKVRLESFHEGAAVQIMHIGSYDTEPATIAKLHGFIKEQGYELRGRHHEIYLSDPRRSKPEKLKTILRQPVS